MQCENVHAWRVTGCWIWTGYRLIIVGIIDIQSISVVRTLGRRPSGVSSMPLQCVACPASVSIGSFGSPGQFNHACIGAVGAASKGTLVFDKGLLRFSRTVPVHRLEFPSNSLLPFLPSRSSICI